MYACFWITKHHLTAVSQEVLFISAEVDLYKTIFSFLVVFSSQDGRMLGTLTNLTFPPPSCFKPLKMEAILSTPGQYEVDEEVVIKTIKRFVASHEKLGKASLIVFENVLKIFSFFSQFLGFILLRFFI